MARSVAKSSHYVGFTGYRRQSCYAAGALYKSGDGQLYGDDPKHKADFRPIAPYKIQFLAECDGRSGKKLSLVKAQKPRRTTTENQVKAAFGGAARPHKEHVNG